jgi:mevalonate kinase
MKQTFYSNGKLLITGEYLVLDGAKAFTNKIWTKLIIEEGSNKTIQWISYDHDGSVWFEIPFRSNNKSSPPEKNRFNLPNYHITSSLSTQSKIYK